MDIEKVKVLVAEIEAKVTELKAELAK